MASRKEYLNYILEQLSGLEEISHRAMMGEFRFYNKCWGQVKNLTP